MAIHVLSIIANFRKGVTQKRLFQFCDPRIISLSHEFVLCKKPQLSKKWTLNLWLMTPRIARGAPCVMYYTNRIQTEGREIKSL